MTTGQYGGIGASVREIDDKVVITEVYEGAPAQKSGVEVGDVIVAVNGIIIDKKNSEDISKFLKGQPGSTVKLSLKHYGNSTPTDFNIKREEIKLKDVPYSGMLNDQVGYIKLTGFTQDAAKEVKEAYTKLKTENKCSSLILDLRGNPGGLLQQAVDIVNLFIDKGQIVATTKGKIKEWDNTLKAVNNPIDTQIPIVVIVDRNSASASEVVSGALQDLDRAVVIGERTYGKGLVQQTRNLVYNSALKVTVAKYYIPSGRCIQALDYSTKDLDGAVLKVPDSLVTAFKTKGGRIVYDGAGIMPDIKIAEETMSHLAFALISKNHIFDYANYYYSKNKNLKLNARTFSLSDSDYQEFISMVKKGDYKYETDSEKELERFKELAQDDKKFEDVEKEYTALLNRLKESKKDDFMKFKDEVKQLLEIEIVSRYNFESGKLEANIKYDKDISTALQLISNDAKIKSILTTIDKPTKPFNPNKKF
jgi:carboxyl-terminal processing protease